MTTVPDQEPGAITRTDRPSRLENRPAGTCDGCRELAARVERLERTLAIRGDAFDPDALGTTRCYWICIGVHAVCALLMFSSETLISYGMMISIGTIATLVVCQVFSTRPVHHRTLRSLLSVSVVASAALFGMWIGDIAAPAEMIPYLVMLFPPVFASAWIVAKTFLWVGGWRIVPPDYTTQYARLQIQHLLLATLLIAAYLAVGRTLATEIEGWLNDDVVVTIVYLIIPTMICTVISCLLARIVLSASARRVVSRCLVVAILAVTLMEVTFAAVAAAAGGMMVDWESLTGVSVYAILLSAGVIASSGGTFAMMRVANYRFHSARSDLTAALAMATEESN